MKRIGICVMLLAAVLCGCSGAEVLVPLPETESAPPAATEESVAPKADSPELLPLLAEPEDGDFVSVEVYLPEIAVELKYASSDNFTGKVIYDFDRAYLRYGTVKKLRSVCDELKTRGLGLKLWDGFRPVQAQFALWEAYPDPKYVADPNKGFGSHTRGNTVDVTLINSRGEEVAMPTAFDDFSDLADRDYSDCTEETAKNALLLQTCMEANGFSGYWGEWWHFSDTDSYDVETTFSPGSLCRKRVVCEEYLTLRKTPAVTSEEILRLPAGAEVTFMGYCETFSLVDFWGTRGYVLSAYLQ